MKKLSLLACLLFLTSSAWALEPVGKVVFVKGSATLKRSANKKVEPAEFNAPVYLLDEVQTQNGQLRLLLTDDTMISVGKSSRLLITQHLYKPTQGKRESLIDFVKGTFKAVIQKTNMKTSQVTLRTPTAVAGIRGTTVGLQVSPDSTTFLGLDGIFDVANRETPDQTVVVTQDTFTEVGNNTPSDPAPTPPGLSDSFNQAIQDPSTTQISDQPGGKGLKSTPPPSGDPGSQNSNHAGGSNPPPPPPPEGDDNPGSMPPPPPGSDTLIPGGTQGLPPDAVPGGSSGGQETPQNSSTQDVDVIVNTPSEAQ